MWDFYFVSKQVGLQDVISLIMKIRFKTDCLTKLFLSVLIVVPRD